MTEETLAQSRSTPPHRAIFLGLATSTVTIGLLLLALEVGLRVAGYGDPATRRDPFEGFEGTGPMFVERTAPGEPPRMVPVPNKAGLPGTEGFLRDKPAGTVRIFTFGGSTTRGVPWGPSGSYSAWLAEALADRHPDQPFEVINLGVSGWGSSRNLEQLREAIAYAPDVFVVYVGINEFRDARFHPVQTRRGSLEARALSVLLSSRAIYFLSERLEVLRARFFGPRITSYGALSIAKVVNEGRFSSSDYYRVPPRAQEVTPSTPDSGAGGLRDRLRALVPGFVRRFLLRRRVVSEDQVYARFRDNLTAMIETARAQGVAIVFLLNAWNPRDSNLIYTAPVSLASVDQADRARWEERYSAGVAAAREGVCNDALAAFDDVVALYGAEGADRDPLLTLYRGECLARTGRHAEARAELDKRLPVEQGRLNAILSQVTSAFGIHVLDLPELLAEHAAHGLVGYENFFVDSSHLTLQGYRIVGRALAAELEAWGLLGSLGPVAPPAGGANEADDPLPKRFRSADSLTALAWSAFQQRRDADAVRFGLAAIDLDPSAVQAHLVLGYAYEKLGRPEETQAALHAVRRLWQQGFD